MWQHGRRLGAPDQVVAMVVRASTISPSRAEDQLHAAELDARLDAGGFGVLEESWFADGAAEEAASQADAELVAVPPRAAPWAWLRALVSAPA
jgi:hypothetical protein